MARRSFENKTRQQNQNEIRIVRSNFTGQYSDTPGNELDPSACREVINATAFPDYFEPREGILQNPDFELPGSYVTGAATKTDTTVILTGIYSSSANVGSWIVYTDGSEPDLILSTTGPTGFIVADNHAIGSSAVGYVRPPVNGWYYHKFLDRYILHLGRFLYVGTPSTGIPGTTTVTWVQINCSGSFILPNASSRIREMGNWAILFCSGIYKIDFINYVYWLTNVEPALNTIAGTTKQNGYLRRYLYTMSKIVFDTDTPSNNPLNTDRTDSNNVVLGQETGSNLIANGQDYGEIYTGTAPVGDRTTVSQTLTCGPGPTLAQIVGSQLFFNIVISDATYTIMYSTPLTASFNDVASAIQNAMNAVVSNAGVNQPCFCAWNGVDRFRIYQDAPGETISVMLPPAPIPSSYYFTLSSGTALVGNVYSNNGQSFTVTQVVTSTTIICTGTGLPSNSGTLTFVSGTGGNLVFSSEYLYSAGWTDVSTALKGTVATSANTSYSKPYYTQGNLKGFSPNQYWKAFTHYSFYHTVDLTYESGVITNDPSAYGWMADYPIMKCGAGSSVDGVNLSLLAGKFIDLDVGNYITIVVPLGGGAYHCFQRTIVLVNSPTTCTLDSAYASRTIPDFYFYIGTATGMILNASAGVVSAIHVFATWNSSQNFNPTDDLNPVDVGDPLFCADGIVRYVTSVGSGTFTVNDTNFSTSGYPASIIPKDSTSTPFGNLIQDTQTTDTVNNYIGTIGLSSRFYRAMSAGSFGVITLGFLAIGSKNTFSWNNIGINQQYIIGNCHPTYQVKQISGTINSITANQNFITMFTSNATLTAQTNLNLTYTDQVNGNVIAILPDPLVVDNYNGCLDDFHVFDFERDLCVVVNQDCGIRTWNGYQFSNNLVYKTIQLKLKALKKFLITYDEKYGVMIFGVDIAASTGSGYRSFNRVYTLGVRQDKYVGASEFQQLPICDIGCQPINVASRMLYFALGYQNQWNDLQVSTWNADIFQDNASGTPRDIAWSFATSDDVASDQSLKLRQLESHLYVSGRGNNQMVPNAVTINCNVYNDVGVFVTITKSIGSFPLYRADITFDKRVEGQRIRYQFTFTNAFLVVNGLTSYYVAYNKIQSAADNVTTEFTTQDDLQSLQTWLTRTVDAVEAVTGQYMQVNGTVNRLTGPDGRPNSGWSV